MDGKNALLILGVMLLIAVGWGWPVLAVAYYESEARKKRGDPPRFDERQHLARQQAGNRALYVLVAFLALWACVDLGGWFDWTGSVPDLALCALPVAWGVWTADCILHDAFLGWKEKDASEAFCLTLAVFFANFINSFRTGGFLRSSIPCFVGYGVMLALGGVLLYKYILRPRLGKKEKEVEDL